MKKLICLLSILTTSSSLLPIIFLNEKKMNYIKEEQNEILDINKNQYNKKLKTINNGYPYPMDENLKTWIGLDTGFWWSGWSTSDGTTEEGSTIVKTGYTKKDFTDYFENIVINTTLLWDKGGCGSGGKDIDDIVFKRENISQAITFNKFSNWIEVFNYKDYWSKNFTKAWVRADWEGDDIKISISTQVSVYGAGASYKYGIAKYQLNSIDTKSKFNLKLLNSNLKKDFNNSNKFVLNSETSNLITSENKFSFVDLREVNSNKELIIAEIKRRIEKLIDNKTYKLWNLFINLDNPKLIFNEKDKRIDITLMNRQDISSNKNILINLSLNVEVNLSGLKKLEDKINSISNKNIKITSDTSANAFDTKNYGDNPQNLSNKEKVIQEINRRIDLTFQLNTEERKTIFNSMYKISLSDEGRNNIKIYFKMSDNQIINTTIKVEIELTNEYYNKGIRKRIEISTGKILDLSKNDGSLIDDKPSYDKDKNMFRYHAPIKLSLALEDDDSSSIMKVNGIEVPIYDQRMEIELKDRRKDKLTEKINYNIEINSKKDGKDFKFDFNITIESTTSSINFKWIGWNPTNDPNADVQYYNQWLMTQETIIDENGNSIVNSLYREDLNKETGTISNLVFVENKNDKNQEFKKDNKFLQDNYDEEWNKIDLTNSIKNGYIAEAIVINSGFKNISINTDQNVYRQKINETTFSAENEWEQVDLENENQFSKPGLYHYKIQENNFVNELVSPTDDDPKEVTPKLGTYIHKIVYINNNIDSLKNNFIDLEFIRNQNMNQDITIKNLWNTYQAKHLKQFLIVNNHKIEDIQKVGYEKIVILWEEYISMTAKDSKLPQPDVFIDLNKYNFGNLIMHAEFDYEFKKIIKTRIYNELRKISEVDLKEGSDYEILISNDNINFKNLNNTNMSELGDIKIKDFDFFIKVKSLNSSVYLGGETCFKGTNSKNANNEFFDLDKLPIYNLVNNFSKFNKKTLQTYIDNFIQKMIKDTNQKWKYKLPILNNDYQIIYEDKIEEFIKNDGAILNISIESLPNSTKAIGSTNFNITNDFKAAEPEPIPEPEPEPIPDGKIDISMIFKNLDLGKIISNKNYLVKNEIVFNKLISLNLEFIKNYNFKVEDFDFIVIKNTKEITEIELAIKDNAKLKGTIIVKFVPKTFKQKSSWVTILSISLTIVTIPIILFILANKFRWFRGKKKRKGVINNEKLQNNKNKKSKK